MSIKHILGICLVLVSFNTVLNSWWNTGHYLTTQIAANNLTSKTRANINKLLKEEIVYPGTLLASQNTSSILEASIWCDYIKNYEWANSENKKVNSMLHYINPITEVNNNVSRSRSEISIKRLITFDTDLGKYNSLNGLLSSIKTLEDKKSSNADKAVALRFVLHLMGDIHTPLHNAAPYVNSFDTKGGNRILLKPELKVKEFSSSKRIKTTIVGNLHSLGDAGGGAFYQIPYSKHAKKLKSAEKVYIKNEVERITKRYHDDPVIIKRGNKISISSWFIESNMVAAYLVNTDKLKYYRSSKSGGSKIYAKPRQSKKYLETVQNLSLQQLYIGGIRLGKLLNAIFDPKSADEKYLRQLDRIKINNEIVTLSELFPKNITFQVK